jgi:hypothetical protein
MFCICLLPLSCTNCLSGSKITGCQYLVTDVQLADTCQHFLHCLRMSCVFLAAHLMSWVYWCDLTLQYICTYIAHQHHASKRWLHFLFNSLVGDVTHRLHALFIVKLLSIPSAYISVIWLDNLSYIAQCMQGLS